jgi:hypothetical protein
MDKSGRTRTQRSWHFLLFLGCSLMALQSSLAKDFWVSDFGLAKGSHIGDLAKDRVLLICDLLIVSVVKR